MVMNTDAGEQHPVKEWLQAALGGEQDELTRLRLAAIRNMLPSKKNRLAFAAAEFALRQKRLILAQENPAWNTQEVDREARRLVYGDHQLETK